MNSNWPRYRLDELGDIVTGKTPPSKAQDAFSVSGVQFVTPRDMDGRRWIDITERYLSKSGVATVRKSLVPSNSVAVSCIGSDMGKAVLLSNASITNQQINTIVVDTEKFNPIFIYYVLSTKQDALKSIAGGSATPILNKGHFGKFEIELPSKGEQDRLVKYLDCLDSKTELNTQTNQTLEQIAQALFKSWFVDFDPVKAKIKAKEKWLRKTPSPNQQVDSPLPQGEGNSLEEAMNLAAMSIIAAKSPKQLAELKQSNPEVYEQLSQTAALFPSTMQESELGEIPKGWRIEISGNIMDVRDGTHDSPKRSDVGYPLITSKHITTGVLALKDAYLISEKDYLKINKRSNVCQGDILLTMIGTVGIPYLIPQRAADFAIKNVGLFKTSEKPLIRNYFFLLLKSKKMQSYLDARMAGTTQKYLSLKALRAIEVLVPPDEVLARFNKLANSVFESMYSNITENEVLSDVRDTLIPKFLSGELQEEQI